MLTATDERRTIDRKTIQIMIYCCLSVRNSIVRHSAIVIRFSLFPLNQHHPHIHYNCWVLVSLMKSVGEIIDTVHIFQI